MTGYAPVIQESLDEISVLEYNVVDVTIRLTIERYSVRLTLAAYPAGPRRMILAAALYATTYVL